MKHKLIDYRNDGENLYIYDYTDASQEVAIYGTGLIAASEMDPILLTFIRDRSTGNILKYIYGNWEYNASEGINQLTVAVEEDWGKEFLVDVFYIPKVTDDLVCNFYLGNFAYSKDDGLYRLVNMPGYSYDVYDTPENLPSKDNTDWEKVLDTSGDSYTEEKELGMSDYENLLSQIRNSEWYDNGSGKEQYVSLFYASTGLELNVPDFPDITPDANIGDFNVSKVECNNYEIHSNIDADNYIGIILTNEITGEIISPLKHIRMEFPYSFSVPGDGIYSIQVTYEIDDTELTSSKIIIYEYCSFKKCYSKLAKDMYCSDLACCDSCDDDIRYEIERRMYELNKMHALFIQLMLAIHGHRVNYLMYHDEGEVTYDKFFASVKKLWEVIEITVNRCGDCDPSHDQDANPCNC